MHLALPPKPIVFHGRDDFVNTAVQLLTQPESTRFAVLGAGGIGKTSVALAILYDVRIAESYGPYRVFQSCEALFDADALVSRLAEQFGVPAGKPQLQKAVLSHLVNIPRLVLVLDNLETLWLANGAPATAVDDLLGSLAQIPTLSLLITCRGIILPQSVRWSNMRSAVLESISLEAALDTFQERAGWHLSDAEAVIAKELLRAVDMMPLAVTLLGQLAQRGTPVSELLNNWNIEHSGLLETHSAGRMNSVEVSIEISIKILRVADQLEESLQLLSVCALLPDGLRPDVFEKLRPEFKNVRRARELLSAYALANMGTDRVLKMLSPVRHLILDRYPAQPKHHNALYSIYFNIANRLPVDFDERFRDLAAAAAPEIGNLSSLMLALVHQPSQQLVDAVTRFTLFRLGQQPTLNLVMALLPHVDQFPQWKADCLQAIGRTQYRLDEYRSSISSVVTAAQLYIEVGNPSSAAECKRLCGNTHRLLGEYENAEKLFEQARSVYAQLGDSLGDARCRRNLGHLLQVKGDHSGAIEHLKAARNTFNMSGDSFGAAQSSERLGIAYSDQGDLVSAAAELEACRSTFLVLGDQFHLAESTRSLGDVRRRQGNFLQAEQCLHEAEKISRSVDHRGAIAQCNLLFGRLRCNQGHFEEAIACYALAKKGFEALGTEKSVVECTTQIQLLQRNIDGQVPVIAV